MDYPEIVRVTFDRSEDAKYAEKLDYIQITIPLGPALGDAEREQETICVDDIQYCSVLTSTRRSLARYIDRVVLAISVSGHQAHEIIIVEHYRQFLER